MAYWVEKKCFTCGKKYGTDISDYGRKCGVCEKEDHDEKIEAFLVERRKLTLEQRIEELEVKLSFDIPRDISWASKEHRF